MPNGFFDFILAAMEDEFIILIEGIESRVWSPLGIPAQLEIGSEMMTDAIQETRLGVLRVFIQLEVMGRLENAEHRAVIDQDRDKPHPLRSGTNPIRDSFDCKLQSGFDIHSG